MKSVNLFCIVGYVSIASIALYSCSGSKLNADQAAGIFKFPSQNTDKGIGPVTEIKLDSINPALAENGKVIFETKCIACHKLDMKLTGPPLKEVTKRRTPEWIMNMVLNPVEMTQKNLIAKTMLENFKVQMVTQDLTKEDARAVLDYLRKEAASK